MNILSAKSYFGSPPFEPSPSLYWGPPPSITDPGVPRIVTLLPATWMGRNCELFVKPNVVVPSNMTSAPIFSLVRMMALLAGAWIFDRVMDMHAATAGDIWDHAVHRHGVAVITVVDTVVERTELVLIAKGSCQSMGLKFCLEDRHTCSCRNVRIRWHDRSFWEVKIRHLL